MSGITLDFDNTFEGFGEIEDGYYECIIEKVYEDASPSGAENVTFRLVIRNDVDQPYKNYKMWERIYRRKVDNKLPMIMFNTIGKAAKLPNGKAYNSLEELMEDYEGKPVLVFVKNETSEYNGQKYENLNVKSWMETKYPNIQHQYKQSQDNNATTNNNVFDGGSISDDELPF